ncbi:nitroreductase/quinone reductase family protein [Nocardiopsis sp. N85]|uniref:nitroreductase/quinone reductase family protein n=1 Tax=Nocardiopsis sp. N85 TaxID=3029400 RepID=UPI00237F1D52|nr:nitroreductase/quinone reductase family protein [Nocardiopsis sp. N85]MDE3719901.1 nitroreductase/quinone reductase family protein [Nocardiopsis sp. N85]
MRTRTDDTPDTPGPFDRPEPHVSDFNEPVVAEFRANGGRVGGMFEGGDLLLLTTVGARSGHEHTTPLGYVRVDGRLLVIGSAGGSDRHPAWYHNLLAHPMVRVELGTEEFAAIAVPAEGDDRDALFAEVVRRVPGYGDYQDGTERILPVIALEPMADEESTPAANLAEALVRVHRWLRGQLLRVREETDAYLADRDERAAREGAVPAPGLTLQLRQHCLGFCESLHMHHDKEEMMFPALAERHPHLADTLRRLSEEHRTVDRIRADLQALLAGLATADPRAFGAELDRMSRELEAHLDHEEATLLPVLAAVPLPTG